MQRRTRNSAGKKSAPKKRRAKKAKVALDSKKLMLLCAAVCASCVLLLAVTAFFSRGNDFAKGAAQAKAAQEIARQEAQKNLKRAEADAKPQRPGQKKSDEKKEAAQALEKSAASKTEQKPAPSGGEKNESAATAKNAAAALSQGAEKKGSEQAKNAEQAKSAGQTKSAAQASSAPQALAIAPPPKNAADGFGFPLAKNGAVLCVVFDDGGQNVSQLKKCVSLPFPVTVAVLPRLAHSAESAAIVRQSGNEVILHQPMQAVNLNVNPGEGAIKPQMSALEAQAVLSQNIAEIAPIAGMNNHEGSLITEDEALVSFILQTAHEKGIYFLDSRTSSATKVPSVSMQMGYGYYQRDIFLDNKKTRENYLSELRRGIDIANKKGHAIMIGHVWSAESLPAFLEEAYPELALKGYRFSTVSKSGGMMQ